MQCYIFAGINSSPIFVSSRKIKNLIFDLGGVIIQLDIPATTRALARLAGYTDEEAIRRLAHKTFFHQYETGHLDDDTFLMRLADALEIGRQPEALAVAWNSMLLHIPAQALNTLRQLSRHYRLFLLSNTNEIHIREVHRRLYVTHGLPDFSSLFEGVYYSHRIRARKPEPAAYQHILQQHGLLAEETMFIDDNLENVTGAQAVGMRGFHFPANEPLREDMFLR
jgi:HAD superfamily hydrolase (TIGR01509 family)